MSQVIRLKIPSSIDSLRKVESLIDETRDKFKLDDDVYGNVMVAVTEAVNNAIIHGNKSIQSKSVHIEITMGNNEVTFSIRDEGKGFEHSSLPDPTAPENIDKPGGRGIFLIRHLADEVEFVANGTHIRITFYL